MNFKSNFFKILSCKLFGFSLFQRYRQIFLCMCCVRENYKCYHQCHWKNFHDVAPHKFRFSSLYLIQAKKIHQRKNLPMYFLFIGYRIQFWHSSRSHYVKRFKAFEESYRSLKPNRVYRVIRLQDYSTETDTLKENRLAEIIADALYLPKGYYFQLLFLIHWAFWYLIYRLAGNVE